jgi:hypothetical protein
MSVTAFLSQWAYIPAIGVGITASLLILLEEWRARVLILALQYLLVTWLVSISIPFSISIVKLICGWLACAILVISARNARWGRVRSQSDQTLPDNLTFKLIAVLIIFIAALGLSRTNWITVPEISSQEIIGTSLLLGLGLLQLGLSTATLRVGLGLMTLLSGFEIAYSVVEPSLAVLALLGSVHIGFALLISYLMLGIGTPQENTEAET